ncbi:MAG: hypothetical protein QOJ15_1437, partial [Bradyrhizobium sp.]|nr:hypothetical protein [Bradyrhizobium sp.]
MHEAKARSLIERAAGGASRMRIQASGAFPERFPAACGSSDAKPIGLRRWLLGTVSALAVLLSGAPLVFADGGSGGGSGSGNGGGSGGADSSTGSGSSGNNGAFGGGGGGGGGAGRANSGYGAGH